MLKKYHRPNSGENTATKTQAYYLNSFSKHQQKKYMKRVSCVCNIVSRIVVGVARQKFVFFFLNFSDISTRIFSQKNIRNGLSLLLFFFFLALALAETLISPLLMFPALVRVHTSL